MTIVKNHYFALLLSSVVRPVKTGSDYWLHTLLPDNQPGVSGEPRQQAAKIIKSKRDTAFCRRKIRPRAMQENGAAARFPARADIVVEHGDEVVEMVLAPQ